MLRVSMHQSYRNGCETWPDIPEQLGEEKRSVLGGGRVQGSSAIQLHDQKRSLRKGLLLPNLIQNDSQFLKLEAWRE